MDNLYNIPVVGLALIDTLVKSKEKLVRTNERVGDILWDGIDVSQYQSVLASLGQSPPAAMAGGRFGILKSVRFSKKNPAQMLRNLKTMANGIF